MHSLYNFVISTVEKVLPLSGIFSDKMKRFTAGRKGLFTELERRISPGDRTIWLHAASLGEYEQAVPVLEAIREKFPQHKIIVSFFSPSGYEIKKTAALPDVVTYLPLDTPSNVRDFLDRVHPEWALFIKYEFWPNFLRELQQRKIPTLLVSGAFREDQLFFKSYGKWMRPYLKSFDHFFVQNSRSYDLLHQIGFLNVSVSGDTRFDRVSRQLQQDNQLAFMEAFKGEKLCLVAGSTWPEDDSLLLDFMNSAPKDLKIIIAPHALRPAKIRQLQEQLQVPSLLYSKMEGKLLEDYRVLIVDTIGLLTRIYSYADIAYVGGAAGHTGLHNILEPATFGIPILIGKNHLKFPEAAALQKRGGLFSVADERELEDVLRRLLASDDLRTQAGHHAGQYVQDNTGATKIIMDYLQKAPNKFRQ